LVISSNVFGVSAIELRLGLKFAISVVATSLAGDGLKSLYVIAVAAVVPAIKPARGKFRRFR
jgi:hypothetical protein